MKIVGKILAGWDESVHSGMKIKLPRWVSGGEYQDLIEASAAVQVAWPGAWLSLSNEGFVVHDPETNEQLALLVVVP